MSKCIKTYILIHIFSTIFSSTKKQRLIEEERQKRKLADRDQQALRRHGDNKASKSPIITNDRFNDLLGEEPKPADKPLQKWKQEVMGVAGWVGEGRVY